MYSPLEPNDMGENHAGLQERADRVPVKESAWRSIRESCIKAAEEMGHTLPRRFTSRTSTPGVKTAMCTKCYGCCWIAFSASRGFGAGGRLLKYRCGTREAAGVL